MIKIDSIDRSEVLRYLSCQNEESADSAKLIMDECEKELLDVISPKYIYRYFDITVSKEGIKPDKANIILEGKDIADHLEGCTGAVFIAASLGPGADRLIRQMQVTDMAKAVITDAFASAATEQICQAAEEKIKNEFPGKYFTWRYAPGYGDFSINIQKKFLDVLDAPRKIGLCTSDSSMLIPVKSVTSVMGVSDNPLKEKVRGCVTCNMKEKCRFRKRGMHCGF